ncbi:hypothetical protein [Kitasatospora sp. NPDC058478]|uniref:hypothetical protein n=1 Tax=unclassified Kitasatospora TaxID=2633591 RepID=UPI003658B654
MGSHTYFKIRTERGGWMLSPAESVHAAANHGDNVSERYPDGSVTITYAIGRGEPSHYIPVTDAEAEAIMNANEAFGKRVAALLAPVRTALAAAENVPDGKHMLEFGGPHAARGGVVASVHGGAVHVYWWHLTHVAALAAEQPGQDPWADGGARDATRAALVDFAREHHATLTEQPGQFGEHSRFLIAPA